MENKNENKLTLKEFSDLVFSAKSFPAEITVCRGEVTEEEPETMLTLKSCFKAEVYLKEEYANAEVIEIYALGMDRFLVAVEMKRG